MLNNLFKLKSRKKSSVDEKPFISFILVKIEGELKETIRKLKEIPGIKNIYPVIGEYNLIIQLEVKDKDEVKKCISQIKSIDVIKGTLTLKVKPPAPEACIDVESEIIEAVGETGIVEPKYGGYEIKVLDESMFPWPLIFKLLLEYGFEIWVTQEKNKIVLSCKPTSE